MECPTCKKMFKNLKQHIFKSHTKLYLTFERKGEEYVLTAKVNDKTLCTKMTSESEVFNTDGTSEKKYFIGEFEKGWYVTLSKDKKVKVDVSLFHPLTAVETIQPAFKNYEVNFVKRKLKSKLF